MDIENRPIIICLTPVRNEAWILDTFLKCTSLWADYIIIADQNSTDGSREIANRYEKVILIENKSKQFNEPERQKLLIAAARKITGKRLLITLDADEIFAGNFLDTADWNSMLNAKEGTVFGFHWLNLLPAFKRCWKSEGFFPWAIMDDNSHHTGEEIHSPRVPVKDWGAIVKLEQIEVLHYQYTDWKRMESKHRYYQCIERLKFPQKPAVAIFRMYNHMYAIFKNKLKDCKEEWFSFYEAKDILLRNIKPSETNWFDDEVSKILIEHGSHKFKKESIWTENFSSKDPRNFIDKMLHFYLKRTTYFTNNFIVKLFDKVFTKIYK